MKSAFLNTKNPQQVAGFDLLLCRWVYADWTDLFALDEVLKLFAAFLMRQQFIAGLLGKGLEVPDRTRICRQHMQHFTSEHFGQCLFSL